MQGHEEEINPTYVRTAVQQADPAALKKHNILSVSHENGIADPIKLIRAQIQSRMEQTGGNSLLVTSIGPGEGKTFTAVNLAVSFSHEVNRTLLLVDADLRNPSVHRCFGIEADRGLSDHLLRGVDLSDLLLNPGLPRLTILPGGAPIANSTELLGAPKMGSLVEEMKRRYANRFLIFDGSPLLTSADALVFSRFVDGILLVVEAEKTSRKNFRRALELLAGKPVLGVVVNKSKDRR